MLCLGWLHSFSFVNNYWWTFHPQCIGHHNNCCCFSLFFGHDLLHLLVLPTDDLPRFQFVLKTNFIHIPHTEATCDVVLIQDCFQQLKPMGYTDSVYTCCLPDGQCLRHLASQIWVPGQKATVPLSWQLFFFIGGVRWKLWNCNSKFTSNSTSCNTCVSKPTVSILLQKFSQFLLLFCC